MGAFLGCACRLPACGCLRPPAAAGGAEIERSCAVLADLNLYRSPSAAQAMQPRDVPFVSLIWLVAPGFSCHGSRCSQAVAFPCCAERLCKNLGAFLIFRFLLYMPPDCPADAATPCGKALSSRCGPAPSGSQEAACLGSDHASRSSSSLPRKRCPPPVALTRCAPLAFHPAACRRMRASSAPSAANMWTGSPT